MDQKQCACGPIFSGGMRTETKFTKWPMSFRRLNIAELHVSQRFMYRW